MASDTWLSKWESLQQLCGLCHDHSFHIPMELFAFLSLIKSHTSVKFHVKGSKRMAALGRHGSPIKWALPPFYG